MEVVGAWLAVFFTLAIFSFLYKDNPVYKFAEHVFVGMAVGYVALLSFTDTILPNFWNHIVGGLRETNMNSLWRIGAGVLGVMLLLRLHKPVAWVSRWSLALIIGTFAGLRLVGLAQSDLIGQINGTYLALYSSNMPLLAWDQPSPFNNLLLIVGVFSVLIYFFFSVEPKGLIKTTSRIGMLFLMVTFGSSYGFTVLARISLLIGRVQDLYFFGENRFGYASVICALAMVVFLVLYRQPAASSQSRLGGGESERVK
jgi:hypothetical protein